MRDAKQYAIHTVSQTKKYQLVYNKRVIDPVTFQTYPYGYLRFTAEDEALTNILLDLQ